MTDKQPLAKRQLTDALNARSSAKNLDQKTEANKRAVSILLGPYDTERYAGCALDAVRVAQELKTAREAGTFDGGAIAQDYVTAAPAAAARAGVNLTKIPKPIQDRIARLV